MLQDLIANLALLTTFLFLTSRISRRQETTIDSTVRAKVQIGVVNGVFGILLMYFSVRIDTDTILDFRQIVIIAAAHFGGLYASIISGAIIALGRISLFGGLNKSSLTATSAALVVGLSSGLLAYYLQPYWKKWFLSIIVSILVTTGSLFWLLDFVSAIKILPYFTGIILAGGLFVAYLIRYLSEANRLMLRLEQSESRYRRLYYLNEAIFQSATEVAIMTTDNEGRFTRFNSGAEQMFGYRAEEVIGIHTPALFHWSVDTTEHTGAGPQPADPLNEEEMLISMARQGIPQDREWTYVTKRGEKVQVHLIVSPVKENGYDIAGFLLVATDITHKKQAEARLLEANGFKSGISAPSPANGLRSASASRLLFLTPADGRKS